jgi:hypothetical protein
MSERVQASFHCVGTPHPNQQAYATLETKPTTHYTDRKTDTGGGYERWRSYEWRPETSRRSKEDVYVPVHRLAAVVWCYPDDMSVTDILADLHGRDVHHKSGVGWDNREDTLTVLGHGEHSSVTNAERRAWARDAKATVDDPEAVGKEDRHCAACGASDGALATTESLDAVFCLDHVMDRADGETIEVL